MSQYAIYKPRQYRKKIPIAIKRAVYSRDNWTCQYCGRYMPPQTPEQERGRHAPTLDDTKYGGLWLELDHIAPYSAGGSPTVENLRAACSPCNRSKADSTAEADWDARIRLAMQILTESEPGRASAQAAVRALTGSPVRLSQRGSLEAL